MADTQARTSVLFVTQAFWASTWYRSHVPGVLLRELGYDVILTERTTPEQVARCDVFATRLWVDNPTAQAMDHAKSLGKLVVLDVDDDVWALHPDNPGFEHYNKPGAGDFARDVVKAADIVTVTTEYLADIIRPINRNVRVIKNHLPREIWPTEPKQLVHEGPLTIGWAGSTSHAPDLTMLSGVVETILGSYPNVQFAFSDTAHLPFKQHERIFLMKPVQIEQYAQLVWNFDIALAPLIDNRFNRAKSDLKFIEYGICGIPMIGSKVLPYEQSVRPGHNGLLAGSGKDWIKHIRRLIEDEDARVSMGAAARRYAETRTIDRHLDEWIDVLGLTPLR